MHGLEADLAERLQVVWLNVADPPGRRAREVFGVDKLPSVILLNAAGDEAYRTEGRLPMVGQIRRKLAELD